MSEATEITATPGQTDTAPAPVTAVTPATAAATDSQQSSTTQPAEYTDFTLPEGMAKDAPELVALIAEAKSMGLAQDTAQKFIDREAARTKQQSTATAEVVKTWASQASADKEIGGDKYQENLAVVGKALDAYATDEFKGLLKATGLIYHPEMLRVLFRAGKDISQDRIVTGNGAPADAPKSLAQRQYPNMNP